MDQTVFDVIERVRERNNLSAEDVLAAAMQAILDAYREALARDPSPYRREPYDPDEGCDDRVLDELSAVMLWQQTVQAGIADQHERDAALGGSAAPRSHALAKVHDNIAMAQTAVMEILDGCHNLALREAGLPEPPLEEPPPEEATKSPGDDGGDRPRLRLAV